MFHFGMDKTGVTSRVTRKTTLQCRQHAHAGPQPERTASWAASWAGPGCMLAETLQAACGRQQVAAATLEAARASAASRCGRLQQHRCSHHALPRKSAAASCTEIISLWVPVSPASALSTPRFIPSGMPAMPKTSISKEPRPGFENGTLYDSQ